MQFPNAAKGVKRIFTAEILSLIGTVCSIIGAIVMRFTGFTLIDPIMSIGVAIFIVCSALGNLKEIMDLFLEKTPRGISVKEIRENIMNIADVLDVHHIHIWSMDGISNYATMHIVTKANNTAIKNAIRQKLKQLGIGHITLELESENEHCEEINCRTATYSHCCHHH